MATTVPASGRSSSGLRAATQARCSCGWFGAKHDHPNRGKRVALAQADGVKHSRAHR